MFIFSLFCYWNSQINISISHHLGNGQDHDKIQHPLQTGYWQQTAIQQLRFCKLPKTLGVRTYYSNTICTMGKGHGGTFHEKLKDSLQNIPHPWSQLEDNPSTFSLFLQSHTALNHGLPTSTASIQQQTIQNLTAQCNNQHRPVSTQGSPTKQPTPESQSETKSKQQSICKDCQSTDRWQSAISTTKTSQSNISIRSNTIHHHKDKQ